MQFKTRFTKFDRRKVTFTKPSRTFKEFQADCDINNILKKYQKTGQLPDMIKRNPQYGDFSNATDYQESLNVVLHANEQFLALPAKVRENFRNDPKLFLEFATNPANAKAMAKLGLATLREPKAKSANPTKDGAGNSPSSQGSGDSGPSNEPKAPKAKKGE